MLSLLLIPLIYAAFFLPEVPVLLAAFRLLFFASVVGAATTLVAMEYFYFGLDDTPGVRKAWWFLVLLLIPIGPPLYCLLVYSRSKYFAAAAARGIGASG